MAYKVYDASHDVEETALELFSAIVGHDGILEKADLDRIRNSLDRTHAISPGHPKVMMPSVEEVIAERGPAQNAEPVVLLMDLSGSMRGKPIQVQVEAVTHAVDVLEAQGVPVTVLGHTTMAWKGGKPKEKWVEAGRPKNPGRLNSLRHITFHTPGQDWEDNRKTLRTLLLATRKGLMKENIDGEAVVWAAASTGAPRIVRITDSEPIDDATMAFNPASILKDHLAEVVETLAGQGVEVASVKMNTRYPESAAEMNRTSRDLMGAILDAATAPAPAAPAPEDAERPGV